MFSYYGSKKKIYSLYPKPIYDLVIEPFSGAAWYSLGNKCTNVVINDLDSVICGIWKWLIHSATPDLLLKYSKFRLGDSITNLPIVKEHKDFLGFLINRGSVSPCNVVTKWSCQSSKDKTFASTVYYNICKAVNNLPIIKNWQCSLGDYSALPDIECTWFIDPPYFKGGNLYKHNDINFSDLADWCISRKGQVIVCESEGAVWLPFKPLVTIYGQAKKSTELIWSNR